MNHPSQGAAPTRSPQGRLGRIVAEHVAWRPAPVPRLLSDFGLTGKVALVAGARRGVTVNNLAPGVIATARNRAQVAAEELVQRIPVGRIGAPKDLVGAALLLCSDAGRHVTGAGLCVGGGRHVA